jgi:hypothetical protein
VKFDEISPNQTKVSIKQAGMPESMMADATSGWNTSLDKFAKLVETSAKISANAR